jgi:acyl-CoA synthetase (AMP-forming)/AMP-acid ligase II
MIGITNLGDIARPEPADHPLITDLRNPDAPRVWTAGELRATAAAVARGLLARGSAPGDRIAILAENRAEFVAAYLGIMTAGMVAVPVNFRLSRETIAFILADANVTVAFTDAARRDLLPDRLPRFDFDTTGAGSFAALLDSGPFVPVVPAAGALAKILYTSGSTGRPKGVPLGHDGQLWALRKSWTGGEASLAERTVIVAPAYHKNGLFFTSVALSNGIAFVSMPRFEPRAYLETVARYRCTILSGIPTMFALMAREKDLLARLDLGSVTTATIGSAPLTDALLQRVRAIFPNAVCQNGYGTTEAGPAVFGPHPDGRPRPGLALGVPYPDVAVRLVGGSTPDEGVLQMRTPALMKGYLNLPKVTAERLTDGWYDSGDIMRRDGDGFYYFVGRADDMFVCGGENVYPGEVEKLLERCPGVAQAAVVPVPDEIKGAIPVAFVVRSQDSLVDEDAVKAFALGAGPAFAHPRFVIFRDSIPVASTHKVDRAALIEAARAHARAMGRF